jgi:malate dehydrogenase (oxaloacetate-decarboxylating)
MAEPYAPDVAALPRGTALLNDPLLNKGQAFTAEERRLLGLEGLLPPGILTMAEQVSLERDRLARKADDLERYIGLAALQDRNEVLFHRLLRDYPDELFPIVYTPTVGQACRDYSRTMRRPRGLWITPEQVDRVPELLHNCERAGQIRLIVATDNERILGLGDQGAGGMGIAVGKLALYCAGAGIHPSMTLPLSIDVGSDNEELLSDPHYIGWPHRRLRGDAYLAVLDAVVEGICEAMPRAVIQWEDLKQHTAIQVLERYRSRLPSFNDDIQGTAAVAVAGILAALRITGEPLAAQRTVLLGAGAAGTGIARLLALALEQEGVPLPERRRAVVLLDSKGVLFQGREPLHPDQWDLALTPSELEALGLSPAERHDLAAVVEAVRPTVLIGTSGAPGTFTEAAVRTLARHAARPIVLPLSNPTAYAEATPEQILAWTGGRALVATGSPFGPVTAGGRQVVIGQANNVFVFPGVGLGMIAGQVPAATDQMFLTAARALAGEVSDERLAAGALYPSLSELRRVSRHIARQVAAAGGARAVDRALDELIWEPVYPEYLPAP